MYDLAWYLADPTWPVPSLTLLNNALRQTGWKSNVLLPDTWRDAVARRLKSVNWQRAVADMSSFLERSQDAAVISANVLLGLVKG